MSTVTQLFIPKEKMTAQNPQPSAHKLSFSEQYSSESYIMLELSEDVFDKVDAVEMRFVSV